MKALIIGILAVITLVLSVVFMPWSELGFGLDPNEITTDSMLSGPLHAFVGAMSSFKDTGEELRTMTVHRLNIESVVNGGDKDPDWNKPVKSGNYAYVLFMAGAMVAASIAIILIGREDAEEKTVLPVKK